MQGSEFWFQLSRASSNKPVEKVILLYGSPRRLKDLKSLGDISEPSIVVASLDGKSAARVHEQRCRVFHQATVDTCVYNAHTYVVAYVYVHAHVYILYAVYTRVGVNGCCGSGVSGVGYAFEMVGFGPLEASSKAR